MYLSMNIFSLLEVCAPIGRLKSLNVFGSLKSRTLKEGRERKRKRNDKVYTSSRTYRIIIISNDPREDRILHEIIIGTTGQCIEMHQVCEI